VEGSGFVYELNGSMYVVTNDHVVRDTTSIGVTFWNGNGYGATVVGADPYADLAVLSVDAPAHEFRPIEMSDSSTLRVGEMVAAVGNPYGLVDSITTGIVSALGRTLTEQYTGSYEIANVIQTSTPINPGNSGGPLLNYDGKVVGITTAAIQSSEGLGFAIPSNTIIRELPSLIGTGRYDDHPYLGGDGEDMSYLAGKELGVNVTYGWMLISVPSGVPLHGHLEAGDVIIGIDGATIKNGDELASYLEENTLPGETVTIRLVRGDRTLEASVVLGRI
jgi:S1-C subfamily serine protease